MLCIAVIVNGGVCFSKNNYKRRKIHNISLKDKNCKIMFHKIQMLILSYSLDHAKHLYSPHPMPC